MLPMIDNSKEEHKRKAILQKNANRRDNFTFVSIVFSAADTTLPL
jgi:hypothetical protein